MVYSNRASIVSILDGNATTAFEVHPDGTVTVGVTGTPCFQP